MWYCIPPHHITQLRRCFTAVKIRIILRWFFNWFIQTFQKTLTDSRSRLNNLAFQNVFEGYKINLNIGIAGNPIIKTTPTKWGDLTSASCQFENTELADTNIGADTMRFININLQKRRRQKTTPQLNRSVPPVLAKLGQWLPNCLTFLSFSFTKSNNPQVAPFTQFASKSTELCASNDICLHHFRVISLAI